jgi:dipeptidase D
MDFLGFAARVSFLMMTALPIWRASALARDIPKNFFTSEVSVELHQAMVDFFELSSLYRKSGSEQNVREFLKGIALQNGFNEFEEDSAGNLKIFVPGTGRYANWGSTRSVALQSHMDMVLDVDGIQSGLEQEGYFKKSGINLVNEGGWVHSEGHKTSIGADDGMGVVSMIRYLRNKNQEHPPLDLIFTANEENGFTGAKGLELSSRVRALVNLDGNEIGTVTLGGHGYTRLGVSYGFKATKSNPKWIDLKVEFKGLHGGHSGLNGHDGYASGASLLAGLLTRLAESNAASHATVFTADAGDSAFNKIPNYFKLTIGIHPKDESRVRELINLYGQQVRAAFPEKEKDLGWSVSTRSEQRSQGVRLKALLPLTRILDSLPTGVVPGYSDAEDLTSNFAFFHLDPDATTDGFKVSVGIMPRFLKDDAGLRFTAETKKVFGSNPSLSMTVTSEASGPAWTPEPRSELARLYEKSLHRYDSSFVVKHEVSKGGLENGQFAERYPSLPMIAIAQANIHDEHSKFESFELQSLEKGILILEQYLKDLADSEIFSKF